MKSTTSTALAGCALLAVLLSPAPVPAAPQGEATGSSPPDASAKKTDEVSTTVEDDMTVRGLSWDMLAGGVPTSGSLIEAELGFSGLPRAAYHYSVAPDLSVGGMVSFDYAYWLPAAAFEPSLLLQAPVRYSLYRSTTLSVGLRADPGFGFFFPGNGRGSFAFGFLLNGSGTIGFTVQNRFIVGGGIDIPMAVTVGGGTSNLAFPLLFGPLFEFHVTPPLALTANLRMGPHLNTNGGVGTNFGMSLLGGIAYRL